MQNRLQKFSYWVALCLIGSIIIISFFFINRAINQKKSDAYFINVAGRQRMLSQKVTQLCLRLSSNPNNQVARNDLGDAINTWQASYKILQNENPSQALSPYTLGNPIIDSLFTDIDPLYKHFISASKQILEPGANTNSLCDSIVAMQAVFLPKMERIVESYEQESEKKLDNLKTLEKRFFIATLLLLLTEALFIFIPIIKRNNRLFEEITNKNNLLSLQNAALQKAIEKSEENKAVLEESEEKFRFIAENTSDGIMIFENGHITYTSPAYDKILGYSTEESKLKDEKAIFGLLHPDDAERIKTQIFQAREGKLASFTYEFRALHKQGYYVWREDTSNLIYDKDGNLFKTIVIARDITKRKQYEKSRVEREQLLASIFDTVSDTIFVLDVVDVSRYRISLVNKIFETTTNIPMDTVIGRYLEDVLPASALQSFTKNILAAITEKKMMQWQETINYPTSRLHEEVTIAPIFDENGHCVRLIGSMHDLTKRVKVQEALVQSHKRLLKLTEKISAAVYEFEMTGDGKTTFPFVSKFITELLPEITIEELQEDGSLALKYVHEEDRDKIINAEKESFERLTAIIQEYRVIHPDGSVRWLKDSSHPERKENGHVVWYGYLQDITSQKEEEERLKLFESAISNSTEGVVITDANAKTEAGETVVFANSAFFKMTGYSFEELTTDLHNKLRGELTDEKETAKLAKAIEEGKPCEIEIINYRKNGQQFWVNIAIAPVLDKEGAITHWIAIQKDVTERNKNIESIKAQNEKLKEIAWIQSHIVRAPLAKVMGLIDLIGNYTDGHANNKVLLKHLNDSAKELDKVIREIVGITDEDKGGDETGLPLKMQ